MTLSDVTSVFSRYFIVGFYLPSFFALFYLWKTLSPDFPPDALTYSEATNVAVLGGIALPVGLLLVGLFSEVLEVLQGNVFTRAATGRWYPLFRPVQDRLVSWQRREFERLRAQLVDPDLRGIATWKLDRYYPADEDALLPTRLGNAFFAGKYHAFKRWGLDTEAIWPRIDKLLSDGERNTHAEAKTDLAFFANVELLALVAGVCLFFDWAINRPGELGGLWVAGTLVFAYLLNRFFLYRAAARWWTEIRSSIDVHRFDLYDKLGVVKPTTPSREQEVGLAISRCLAYGVPLPARLRRRRP